MQSESYRAFYKYLGKTKTITAADIRRIQESNYKKFETIFLNKYKGYRNGNLIKDIESENSFIKLKKAHKTLGYVNVYIQKKFIYALNYSKRTDSIEHVVEEGPVLRVSLSNE